MKSIPLIFISCLIFSLISCSQDFKKLNKSEVDSDKVQIAQKFANDYFIKMVRITSFTMRPLTL